MENWQFGHMSDNAKGEQYSSYNYDRLTTDTVFLMHLHEYMKVLYLVDYRYKAPYPLEVLSMVHNITEGLIREAARCLGVKISEIKVKPLGKTLLGSYNDGDQSITINEDAITDKCTIQTIMHELRHAEQHQKLSKQDTEFGRSIKSAQDNYVLGAGGYICNIMYNINLSEFDAEQFSYGLVEKIADIELKASVDDVPGLTNFIRDMRDASRQRQVTETSHDLKCMTHAYAIDKAIDDLDRWRHDEMEPFYNMPPDNIDAYREDPSTRDERILLDAKLKGMKNIAGTIGEHSSYVVRSANGEKIKDADDQVFNYIFQEVYSDISLKEFLLTYSIDPFLRMVVSQYKSGNNEITRELSDDIRELISYGARTDGFFSQDLTTQERIDKYAEKLILAAVDFCELEFITDYWHESFSAGMLQRGLKNCKDLLGADRMHDLFSEIFSNRTITINTTAELMDYYKNEFKKYGLTELAHFEFNVYKDKKEYNQSKGIGDDIVV